MSRRFASPNGCEGAGPSGAPLGPSWGEKNVVIPRSWILQDDGAGMTTLKVKLPGCDKDRIVVKLFNERHLLVDAVCLFYRYELQYEIPLGARLHCDPTFGCQTEIVTCRFKAINPVCVFCHASAPLRPIQTKEEFASVFNGCEFVQPRHKIIYDGNTALLEAHLDGCKNYSQINFHIANNKVVLSASLSPQHYYFLGLRLESSAQCDWKASFNPRSEKFTCIIPLLGHYACGKCMAKRHNGAAGTSKENAEKVGGTHVEKASSKAHLWTRDPTAGQCNGTATATENAKLSLDVTGHE